MDTVAQSDTVQKEVKREGSIMLARIIEWFVERRTPPVSREDIRKDVEAANEATGRAVAQQMTRGNASIAAGSFITTEDLEREREEAREYTFVTEHKRRGLLPRFMLFPIEQLVERKHSKQIAQGWAKRRRGGQQ